MDWSNFWNEFLIWLETEGLMKFTSLVLVIIIGFIAIRILLRIIKKAFLKTRLDNTVGDFLLSIIKFCLYLVWVLAMISSLGVSLTGFTVIATALSLGVSLALENLLSNLVNGFVIISGKLFKEGDWVQIGDDEGEVKGIHILYTKLNTADNKQISIPNSQIMTKSIINFNSQGTRRVDVAFVIANFESVDKTKQIMEEVVNKCDYILKSPKPFFAVIDVSELGATITTRVWVDAKYFWDTKFYLIDNIFNELKRNKVAIAKQNIMVEILDGKNKVEFRKELLSKVKKQKEKQT